MERKRKWKTNQSFIYIIYFHYIIWNGRMKQQQKSEKKIVKENGLSKMMMMKILNIQLLRFKKWRKKKKKVSEEYFLFMGFDLDFLFGVCVYVPKNKLIFFYLFTIYDYNLVKMKKWNEKNRTKKMKKLRKRIGVVDSFKRW